MDYDIIIIGAGPGGYVAAIRAAQEGYKTALVEKDEVGGTCLNYGCIPSKLFAAAAERLYDARLAAQAPEVEGLDASKAYVNILRVVERKDKVVAGLRLGIHQLLKSNKVDFIKADASLISDHKVRVAEKILSTDNVIIATGSKIYPLSNLAIDGQKILSSDHIFNLTDLPNKLLIVGGGAIGCEFACIMNAFGVEVTIVEMMDQILPMEDAFIARALTSLFKRRGIKIRTNATVTDADIKEADKVLVSVGRRPYTENLSLEKIGVKIERGFVVTNDKLQTTVPNIYAIGDVANYPKPMLAHVASFEARVAVSNIKSNNSISVNYNVIPRPIFTGPEIGCVGMTEKKLKENGVKYKTGRFSYAAASKAICDDLTDGALITYVGEDDKILGAHCIGTQATLICSEVALAMQNGLTVNQVLNTIHAHPTYSEIVVEALEDAYGRAVHKAKK